MVGAAHAPGLRSLHIEAAPVLAGGNARPIVVGCRGPHPDLSQLAVLAMAPSINLCVNFLRYLSSLPRLSLCEGLQRAVDAYLGRRCIFYYYFLACGLFLAVPFNRMAPVSNDSCLSKCGAQAVIDVRAHVWSPRRGAGAQ